MVVSAKKGEIGNKHRPVLEKHGLRHVHLYEGEDWVCYEPKSKMRVLHEIYPRGIEIPKRLKEGGKVTLEGAATEKKPGEAKS